MCSNLRLGTPLSWGNLYVIIQADDIGMWHQIWYEDEQSLQFKYTLVESINLAGEFIYFYFLPATSVASLW